MKIYVQAVPTYQSDGSLQVKSSGGQVLLTIRSPLSGAPLSQDGYLEDPSLGIDVTGPYVDVNNDIPAAESAAIDLIGTPSVVNVDMVPDELA